MAEMTLEQKRAVAIARARAAAAAAGEDVPASPFPGFAQDLMRYINPVSGIAQSATKNILRDVIGTDTKADSRDSTMGKIDATVRGAADTLSFGLSDEMAAAADAGLNPLLGTGNEGDNFSDRYAKNVALERATDAADSENRFEQRLGGQLSGAVLGGAGLAKLGLSPTTKAVENGASLLKTSMLGAGEGGILGALQGLGSGTGVEDRINKGGVGMLLGSVLGGAAPAVVAGASKLLSPIASRLNPESGKLKVLQTLMQRSGMTPDDIEAGLTAARTDGQDMFTVADTLGNAGQRALSTVVRNPNDARQPVVEALLNRQQGQGERLTNFLTEGFDAPNTAAKTAKDLTSARRIAADANYSAARNSATAVDPSAAIQKADDFLSPGANSIMSNQSGIPDNSIQSAVSKAKSYLTDGKSVLTDFNAALNSKREMDAMIETASPTVQRQLIPIRDALDDALANASKPYSTARDTFRQQSKVIEAVNTGTTAASPRMRAQDTIPQFQNMTPEEQAAFRVGYVDPKIAQIEAASAAPTTNKARMLSSGKTGQEIPAFATPGKADTLVNRIGREDRMFQTSNAALGGSKTADNLADAADNGLDPGFVTDLASGNLSNITSSLFRRALNSVQGMNPQVLEKLAPALMETDPAIAKALFGKSLSQLSATQQQQAKVVSALLNSGSAGVARLSP